MGNAVVFVLLLETELAGGGLLCERLQSCDFEEDLNLINRITLRGGANAEAVPSKGGVAVVVDSSGNVGVVVLVEGNVPVAAVEADTVGEDL